MSASGPGRTFGGAAEAYERGRPEWPAELLDAVPVPAGSRVLDLGAGTGKLTRLLATRHRVVAVEPDDAMRALIRDGEVVAGTAEAIPLPDGVVDAVFAGDSFHWFDPRQALAEVARVLRLGGVVALAWNRFDPADYILPDGVMPELPAGHPGLGAEGWRRAFDDAPFEPLREVLLPQDREVARGTLLDYFASVSPVTALAPTERLDALERIAGALDRRTYRQRWTVTVFWTRRAG